MSTELINLARSGDEEAFHRLVSPYQRELQVHCYRILGSAQDAEDALQETLLAAWRGLPGFGERASIRTWLYRIATSRCLNMLRSASRRPQPSWSPPGTGLPEPTRLGEVTWLEPYPDHLMEGLADTAPGPEARYEAREAISLAFVTALQLLPPRQRAVLILRDVLGFRAREAAGILDATEESVTSALKRARATLQQRMPPAQAQPPPPPGSASELELVRRLTRAFEAGEVDNVVALLTDDVWLSMPPSPLEYQGRQLAGRFFAAVSFRDGRRYQMAATRANGQPALAAYVTAPGAAAASPNGLLVLTLTGNRICAITRFGASTLTRFGVLVTADGDPRPGPDLR